MKLEITPAPTRTSTVWPLSPGHVDALPRGDVDDLEGAALGVVVVLQHRDVDLAAGAHLGDVGAGDRRLVDGDVVGDGDDDDGADRVGAAVGDAVAERRAGRRAGATVTR